MRVITDGVWTDVCTDSAGCSSPAALPRMKAPCVDEILAAPSPEQRCDSVHKTAASDLERGEVAPIFTFIKPQLHRGKQGHDNTDHTGQTQRACQAADHSPPPPAFQVPFSRSDVTLVIDSGTFYFGGGHYSLITTRSSPHSVRLSIRLLPAPDWTPDKHRPTNSRRR